MKTYKQCVYLALEVCHLLSIQYSELDVDDVTSPKHHEELAPVFKELRDRILEDGECELFNIYKVYGWLDLGLAYTGHDKPLLITVYNVQYRCEQLGPAPDKFWFAWDGDFITYEDLKHRVLDYNSDVMSFDYKVEQV